MHSRLTSPSNKGEIYLTAPDNALRKKIGRHVALADIFTPEKLQHCQQMIDQTLAGFVQEMEAQLNVIGNEYINAAENPAQAEAASKKAAELSFVIKKRMEALNFVFGYNVAQSLCDYIKDITFDSDALLVICKHLAVLNLIIKDGIKGDGGSVEREMLANLTSLIKKTRK